MVGRKKSEQDLPECTRGGPILSRVRVFPHGECNVKGQFERLASAFAGEKGRWRLEKYSAKDLRFRFNPGRDSPDFTILTTNPWARRPESCPMPQGYYDSAGGTTDVWVECWHCVDRGFCAQLGDFLGESNAPGYDAFLEVSCLTWFYSEMGDWETDLVIQLECPEYSGEPRAHYGDHDRHLREAARTLAEQMESHLKSVPASEESQMKRLAREEKIRSREQERADELARKAAEQAAEQQAEAARRQKYIEQAGQAARDRGKRAVIVIYDSSYLMSNQMLLHESFPINLEPTVTNIVPVEVQKEIEDLLKPSVEEEKRRRASLARKKVVALKEQQNQKRRYEAVRMADFVSQKSYSGPLMPDSRTDSLLVGYGKHLLQTGSQHVVVVASNDGGILNLVNDERTLTGLDLYCISDPSDSIQIQPFRNALRGSAVIESLSVELVATLHGARGMRLNVVVRIMRCQGDPCSIFASFFQMDGQPLRGFRSSYSDPEGNLRVGTTFVPQSDKARFDTHLFLPDTEVRLPLGKHDLKYQVRVNRRSYCLTRSNDGAFTMIVEPG